MLASIASRSSFQRAGGNIFMLDNHNNFSAGQPYHSTPGIFYWIPNLAMILINFSYDIFIIIGCFILLQ